MRLCASIRALTQSTDSMPRTDGRLPPRPVFVSSSEMPIPGKRSTASKFWIQRLAGLRQPGTNSLGSEIEHTMYVLNVDLWSEDALREVNLVRHTTATPSISSTTPASYAQVEATTPAFTNILPSSHPHGQMGYPAPNVAPYMQQQGYQASGTLGFSSPRTFSPTGATR